MKAPGTQKKRESRTVWANRYRQWKKSHLSKVSFCKQQGIDTSCFYFWCGVFRKEESEDTITMGQKPGNSPFLPVNIIDTNDVLTIESGGIKLSYAGVLSGEQLYQWIEALRRATCSA